MTLPNPNDPSEEDGTTTDALRTPSRERLAGGGIEEGPELEQLSQVSNEVARRVHAKIGAADGVSVVAQFGDTLVFGSSNTFTAAVDAVQRELMEGPCLLAMTSGEVISTRWIGIGERRWPRFTSRTAPLRLQGVESTPLLANGAVTGSVNLYVKAGERLDEVDSQVFADALRESARALGSARLIAVVTRNTRWLKRAADDSADIARAVGWLMDRYRMSAPEGRTLIAQLARQDDVDEPTAARSLIDPDTRRASSATDSQDD